MLRNLMSERLASTQAGAIAAATFAALALLKLGILLVLTEGSFESWRSLSIQIIAALITGFVFGITYRYAVRQDRNAFLGDGVVLAFTLTRLGGGLATAASWRALTILGIESLCAFATARWLLDWALCQQKLPPATQFDDDFAS